MFSEIVLFRLPEGMSRADAMAKYRARVPIRQANPDLIHKAFLFDETSRRGGGVYLWKNIEAATQPKVRVSSIRYMRLESLRGSL